MKVNDISTPFPPKPPVNGELCGQNQGRKAITERLEKELLGNSKGNRKHHLIILLMLDAGLRVTEAVSLKISNISVARKSLVVASLKKKSENPIYREIPMTARLYAALTDYVSRKEFKPDSFLFPSCSKKGHITRIAVWKFLKRYSGGQAHPHLLRHTCATKLVEKKTDLVVVRDILGHRSTQTTEIYLHARDEQKIQAVGELERKGFIQRIGKLFSRKKELKLPVSVAAPKRFEISRKIEVMKLKSAMERRINTIVLGEQGVGKSYLLEKFRNSEDVLFMSDLTMLKTTLQNMLLHLQENGHRGQVDIFLQGKELKTVMQKKSAAYLIEMLFAITEKNQYTLMIEDISHLTKGQSIALEKLKSHFHIITAARSVKIAHAAFLTNFQKIELENFKRLDAKRFIFLSSRHIAEKIGNYSRFETHVWNETNGNPLLMKELIERLAKEQYIDDSSFGEVQVVGAKKEFDFSLVLIVGLSAMMVLRYVGGEIGSDIGAFKLFGGMALVFAIFARTILQGLKRRFV